MINFLIFLNLSHFIAFHTAAMNFSPDQNDACRMVKDFGVISADV